MSNVGQSNIFSDASEYNTLAFVIARATEKMQTVSIVQVKAVDTGAQTVDVQVLVNLVTGASQSIPHGVISARPYYRAQGGGNAIILDPVVGDIGVMVFASRDSSAVIAAKGLANPGSQRKFSWSDGVYFGGILNAAPTQYLKFLAAGGGITMHSPGDITLDSPLTNVTGDLVVDGDATVDGTSTLTGAVDAPAGITTTTIAGVSAVFSGSVTASSFIGGGGGGGVTSVATGTGLTGGPITTSGTISLDSASIASLLLANSALQPNGVSATVTNANLTIVGGQITAASSGSGAGGTVTSVGISTPGTGVVVGGGPITSSGTLTVDLSSAAYAALVLAVTALQSISIATGTGLTGGPLGASGSTVALSAATIASLLPASPVQGDIAYYSGSAWVNLAPGTAGFVLQTNGVGANPTWVAAGGGSTPVPATIPDLQFWWESDNILGASGAIVTRLQERTPWIGGLAASADSANGGSVAIDSTQLNGLNVLVWPAAAVAGIYSIPSPVGTGVAGGTGMTFFNGATIFIVAKGSSSAATQAILGGANNCLALYLVVAGGTAKIGLVQTGTAVIGSSTTAWTAGTFFQANATYNPTTGAFVFRQGRAAAGSGTGATGAGNLVASITNLLGGDVGSSSPLDSSSHALVIAFNRVLSPTEITNMEAYIFNKWGV